MTSTDSVRPISAAHPLGTDYLGRDMLSRMLTARATRSGVALASATLLASGIGTLLGAAGRRRAGAGSTRC